MFDDCGRDDKSVYDGGLRAGEVENLGLDASESTVADDRRALANIPISLFIIETSSDDDTWICLKIIKYKL